MPRRYSDYPDSFYLWNLFSSVGAWISLFSLIYFCFLVWEGFSRKIKIYSIVRPSSVELSLHFPLPDHSISTSVKTSKIDK
jgi:cytochrome c oxidase subunit 1